MAGLLPLSEEIVSKASGNLFRVTNPDRPWSRPIAGVAAHVAG